MLHSPTLMAYPSEAASVGAIANISSQWEIRVLFYLMTWLRPEVVNYLQASSLFCLHQINVKWHCDNCRISTVRNDHSWSPSMSTNDRWLFYTGRFHPLLLVTFFWGVRNHLKTRAGGKTSASGRASLQKMIKDIYLLFPLMMLLMNVFLLLATTVVNTFVWKLELSVSVSDKHYICYIVCLFLFSMCKH